MAALFLILLFSILSSSSAYMSITRSDDNHGGRLPADDEIMALYETWLVKHGKSYDNNAIEEKTKRFEIFKDNLRYIEQQNSVANRTYKLGLNRFADLTNEEFRSTYLGTSRFNPEWNSSEKASIRRHRPEAENPIVVRVDWRNIGAVPPIKDQGRCRGSWAFSTISSVEAINFIKTGTLIQLSEQEIVDCNSIQDQGCYSDGYIESAFGFIINNGGIDSEKDYPYTGRADTPCDQEKSNRRVVTINGYQRVLPTDENTLMDAVNNQVVSAYIDASSIDFQLYHGGIYSGECGVELNHAVSIVGYRYGNVNLDSNGARLDFWIVRNSWGENWGENGYINIRMKINPYARGGNCGITKRAYYPVKEYPNPPLPPQAPTMCDDYVECSSSETCCCSHEISAGDCAEWRCCPPENPSCCLDHVM